MPESTSLMKRNMGRIRDLWGQIFVILVSAVLVLVVLVVTLYLACKWKLRRTEAPKKKQVNLRVDGHGPIKPARID